MNKYLKNSSTYFYILIRHWNAFEYLEKCINSVLSQTYDQYKILFVDDASLYSKQQRDYIRQKLKGHVVIFNRIRKYAVRNAFEILRKYADNPDGVVVNLDGDDWFFNNSVLNTLNQIYIHTNVCLTFGNCVVWNGEKYQHLGMVPKLSSLNRSYSAAVIKNNSYRFEPFLPLHPRTWKVWLFQRIKKIDFLRPDGSWLQFAEDQAIFYPMLEMAAGRFKAISKPLSVYNMTTANSDVKINTFNLIRDELIVRKKTPYAKLNAFL